MGFVSSLYDWNVLILPWSKLKSAATGLTWPGYCPLKSLAHRDEPIPDDPDSCCNERFTETAEVPRIAPNEGFGVWHSGILTADLFLWDSPLLAVMYVGVGALKASGRSNLYYQIVTAGKPSGIRLADVAQAINRHRSTGKSKCHGQKSRLLERSLRRALTNNTTDR